MTKAMTARGAELHSRLRDPNHAARAFTFLELLIVLVVLGLLGLVMVPALASSRHQGARTVCNNNLRRLGAASLLYASDNRDYMAYPNWGNDRQGWLYSPSGGMPPSILTDPDRIPAGYRGGLWFPYVQDPACYLCPIDNESKYYLQRANKLSSYVMNGAVCGYGTSITVTARLTEIWNPGCYLLWAPDELKGSPPIGSFAFNDASSYPDRNEGMGRHHSPVGSDLLTVGGSVQFVPDRRFAMEQATNRWSLTWWSPFSTTGR
jgi:type II secretory pathway pseudopilin PulG